MHSFYCQKILQVKMINDSLSQMLKLLKMMNLIIILKKKMMMKDIWPIPALNKI